ncbi:DUF4190 domain-containing protein [Glycomyces xiaoerkulensis]|uniref:DUF4190 domain-containing protein n=1 Tax=Glycomyces xiaoerkulensis TaxID=2038139 RepID=UPI000C26B7B0|nr:DUF4190 domain-containing protein [Glycomyces xiaoerkulensis]
MSSPDPYAPQPPPMQPPPGQAAPGAYPPPPQPGMPPPYPPYQTGVEINGKAVAAMVCGLIFMTSPLGIMGLAFGKTAQRQIEAGQGIGRPLAKAGRVLGWVSVGFTIFWALYIIAAIVAISTAVSAV